MILRVALTSLLFCFFTTSADTSTIAKDVTRNPPAAVQVYRPRSPDEVCGNSYAVAALSKWLGEWKDKRSRGRPGDGGSRSPGCGEDSGEESEVRGWGMCRIFMYCFNPPLQLVLL